MNLKLHKRLRSKRKIRKKIIGTSECPRLTIFKSLRYLYVQVIDDSKGMTICSSYSRDRSLVSSVALAEKLTKNLKSKSVKKLVFDRNGYKYVGIVKSFADHLRKQGIVI